MQQHNSKQAANRQKARNKRAANNLLKRIPYSIERSDSSLMCTHLGSRIMIKTPVPEWQSVYLRSGYHNTNLGKQRSSKFGQPQFSKHMRLCREPLQGACVYVCADPGVTSTKQIWENGCLPNLDNLNLASFQRQPLWPESSRIYCHPRLSYNQPPSTKLN